MNHTRARILSGEDLSPEELIKRIEQVLQLLAVHLKGNIWGLMPFGMVSFTKHNHPKQVYLQNLYYIFV